MVDNRTLTGHWESDRADCFADFDSPGHGGRTTLCAMGVSEARQADPVGILAALRHAVRA